MDIIIESLEKIATRILANIDYKGVTYKLKMYPNPHCRVKQRRKAIKWLRRRRSLRETILKYNKAVMLAYNEDRQIQVYIEAVKLAKLVLKKLRSGELQQLPSKESILRNKPFWKKKMKLRCKVQDRRPNWRYLSPSVLINSTIFESEICSPGKFKTLIFRLNRLPTRDQGSQCELDTISAKTYIWSAKSPISESNEILSTSVDDLPDTAYYEEDIEDFSNDPSYIEPPPEFRDVPPMSLVKPEEEWQVFLDDIGQNISVSKMGSKLSLSDSSPVLKNDDFWYIYNFEIDFTIPKYELGRIYVDAHLVTSPKSIKESNFFYTYSSEEDQFSEKIYCLGRIIPESIRSEETTIDYEESIKQDQDQESINQDQDQDQESIIQDFRIEDIQDYLPDLNIEDFSAFEPPVESDENWRVSLKDNCQPTSVRKMESESATIDDSPPVEHQEDVQNLKTEDSISYITAVENVKSWYISFYEIDHTIPTLYYESRVIVKTYILTNSIWTENFEIHSPKIWNTLPLCCHANVETEDDLNQSSLDKICKFKSQCELDQTSEESYILHNVNMTPKTLIDDEEWQDILPDLSSMVNSCSIPSVENEEDWPADSDNISQSSSQCEESLKTYFIDGPQANSKQEDPQDPSIPSVKNEEDLQASLNNISQSLSQCEETLKAYFIDEPQANSKTRVMLSNTSEDPPSVDRHQILHDFWTVGPSGFNTPVDGQNMLDEKKKLTTSDTAYLINFHLLGLTYEKRRQSLLDWCKSVLQVYGIPMYEFSASWKNGRALVALIHCYHKHLIEVRFLTKESRRNTLIYGAKIARSLGVIGSKNFVRECLKKKPSQFEIIPFVNHLHFRLLPCCARC